MHITHLLHDLYGPQSAEILPQIQARIAQMRAAHPEWRTPRQQGLTQRDAILIAYGDHVQMPDAPPLRALDAFLRAWVGKAITTLHLLPFYPYSSDDGFAVIDYTQVSPALGTWEDIAALGKRYRLMFDLVLNHVSTQSPWFQGFLRGEAPYDAFFITPRSDDDLSQVVRPRTTPLLHTFETARGPRKVWTTFSADQVDLNYANPQVLLAMLDVLLEYVKRGAQIIRLDAIAYLWKESGTPCIHLPQTHTVIKLLRAVLDEVAPHVLLITETNVPHEENISYFGSPQETDSPAAGTASPGGDEAQMVYQFPLAPLVLHTFLRGDCRTLSRWARSLYLPFPGAAFFNFIASHDGIGVRPAEGLLAVEEIEALVQRTLEHGGQVSRKSNPDGSSSPYELNITLYDWLNNPQQPSRLDVPRFLASQAVMLSLAGVPGIYFNSLIGARNCHTCVEESGRARSINRQKFTRDALETTLADPQGHSRRVLDGYLHLLRVRAAQPAFHPQAAQQVLDFSPACFALRRGEGAQAVLCLVNVTDRPQEIHIPLAKAGLPPASTFRDLLTGTRYPAWQAHLHLPLAPYQTLWLRAEGENFREH
ncbi:MAG: DUF3459 domain-containing protein [Anaerolineae bacterium]|nr:MAG: DUF3459 domain-containing protein [Anaerolineae bacterium]